MLAFTGSEPTLVAASQPVAQGLTDAARDVLAERQRQVNVEGWTANHDDVEHDDGELAGAASAYALAAADKLYPHSLGDAGFVADNPPASWPTTWVFKPADPRRMLVKAGALILAEIERLDRATICATHQVQADETMEGRMNPRITARTVHRTSDGVDHDSLELAMTHQARLDLTEELRPLSREVALRASNCGVPGSTEDDRGNPVLLLEDYDDVLKFVVWVVELRASRRSQPDPANSQPTSKETI
jgi:hypothetical protein